MLASTNMAERALSSLKVVLLGLVAVAALLASAATASGATQAVDFPDKPPSEHFYVDNAGMLTTEDARQIDEIADSLLKQRGIPIFVVTIENLTLYEARSLGIEDYAQALFNHWGIGSQEHNYGVLLLISQGDRKARIQLGGGYGFEFDVAAQRIMDKLIIPNFKREAFSTGILDGVRGLDAMARGERIPARTQPWWVWPAAILAVIGLIFAIYSLFKSGRKGWAWALIVAVFALLFFLLRMAGSVSSDGGFDGGSSDGGGATGDW